MKIFMFLYFAGTILYILEMIYKRKKIIENFTTMAANTGRPYAFSMSYMILGALIFMVFASWFFGYIVVIKKII